MLVSYSFKMIRGIFKHLNQSVIYFRKYFVTFVKVFIQQVNQLLNYSIILATNNNILEPQQ